MKPFTTTNSRKTSFSASRFPDVVLPETEATHRNPDPDLVNLDLDLAAVVTNTDDLAMAVGAEAVWPETDLDLVGSPPGAAEPAAALLCVDAACSMRRCCRAAGGGS